MRLGFTGTRGELTSLQSFKLGYFLSELINISEAHHGDCVGGDALFHDWCMKHNLYIIIHPPSRGGHRAFCEGGIKKPVADYLDRNRDIVDSCDLLIACPKEKVEQVRSGTWYTVRYARQVGRPTLIIYP